VVTLLGRFIVDFVAPELRLVIEVDGAYHRSRHAADARRDRALVRAGYHVLRIDAELVMREGDVAATRVREAIEQVRGGGT
jgi:very-short-patch-repair endonuclease